MKSVTSSTIIKLRGVRNVLGASPIRPCPLLFTSAFFFFFSQAAKHIFIETYSRQSASQNYRARVKAASQMLCKYHIFISSLCFATFKHVCGRSAAPSGDRLDA